MGFYFLNVAVKYLVMKIFNKGTERTYIKFSTAKLIVEKVCYRGSTAPKYYMQIFKLERRTQELEIKSPLVSPSAPKKRIYITNNFFSLHL